jgi:hypothetical protein
LTVTAVSNSASDRCEESLDGDWPQMATVDFNTVLKLEESLIRSLATSLTSTGRECWTEPGTPYHPFPVVRCFPSAVLHQNWSVYLSSAHGLVHDVARDFVLSEDVRRDMHSN